MQLEVNECFKVREVLLVSEITNKRKLKFLKNDTKLSPKLRDL